MKLFITGDAHAKIDIQNLIYFNRLNPELTKEDVVIVLGDCGAVWFENDTSVIEMYDNFNFTTMFVLGNHENYDLIYQYPKTRLHEGMCYEISSSLYAMQNGEIFDFNGKKFFVMGGATSIDKDIRVPHISWWEQEIPTKDERLYALENIIMHNNTVDYILTHTPAAKSISELYNTDNYKIDEYAYWLNILFNVTYKQWYCGHMHVDEDLSDNVHILFNDIVELGF